MHRPERDKSARREKKRFSADTENRRELMQKKWYRLDTAALIFPAIARRDWSNAFRVSASLREDIDPSLMEQAVEDLRKRFPTFYVSLHKGVFWYYLEESGRRVQITGDYAYPLTFMSRRELKKNCLRILIYRNRVAAEFFHSLTDGRGGMIYLMNLVAHYLTLKNGVTIPPEGILRDINQAPDPEELEDSFLRNAAETAATRKEPVSFRLRGTREAGGFKHLVTGTVETASLLAAAHRYGVSVTAFLAAVMAQSIIEIQDGKRRRKRQRAVKITVPVDLRRLYGSRTMRNFSLVLNVGVNPRFGTCSFDELCRVIYHQLCAGATRQNMAGMIAANVLPQKAVPLRLAPVILKNIVMNGVYRRSGESGGSLNISNLGELPLPEQMCPYIRRVEFIIGPQRSYPNNCSVVSFNGKTCINMIRNIQESELERRFFSHLVEMGIAVEIESNGRAERCTV